MSQQRFPKGWDEERVKRLTTELDARTDEEWIAEDEAAFENERETVMTVPRELVPVVRELIAKHKRAG